MQAITTKYIGPTNVRGSKIKATAAAGSVTLHWDDSMNSDNNHKAAAKALATKLGWDYGDWIAGVVKDGSTVWVCNTLNQADKFTISNDHERSKALRALRHHVTGAIERGEAEVIIEKRS